MHDLLQLQKTFYLSIFNKKSDLEFISSTFAAERFDIYRKTIFENMRNSLKITFPGIWKLLGEECANSAAYAFCNSKENLPYSGCLDYFGHSFHKFLGKLVELQDIPYLEDYALYEWLKHMAYIADKGNIISIIDLQNILEQNIDDIKIFFIPSLSLMKSHFSIPDIQNVVENPDAGYINLKYEPSYAIVARPQDEIITFWTSLEIWRFIKYLADGYTLYESYSKELSDNSEFDLTKALLFIIQNQLISKIIYNGDINEN